MRKSTLKEAPPPGWPPDRELVIRRVVTRQEAKRRERRASCFLRVEWGELIAATRQINTDRVTRLWLTLVMLEGMDDPEDGWLEPRRWMLMEIGVAGSHYADVLARLEGKGLIEVERSPGKRARVRLVKRLEAARCL